jgi:hypothetical protein
VKKNVVWNKFDPCLSGCEKSLTTSEVDAKKFDPPIFKKKK